MPIPEHISVLIIGSGPAGLAAAHRACSQGMDVVLLDEQRQPGGQIFRAIGRASQAKLSQLGEDYVHGKSMVERFLQSAALYLPQSKVWAIEKGRDVYFSRKGRAYRICADKIILTSGAMERPVPFPGWTLPGVMNAGAGQILYKAHDIVPDNDVVLAGSGPLLLLLAWQYLRVGVKVQAILDITPSSNRWRALKHLPAALKASHYLLKGLKYEWDLRQAGIRFYRGVKDLKATGTHYLEGVEFTRKGKTHRLSTAHLLVHFGVIPSNQLSQIAGCKHSWNDRQGCWLPQTDLWGQSSEEHVLIAGDGAAIGGAKQAELQGELAALRACADLGVLEQASLCALSAPLLKKSRQDASVRPFLETYFQIPAHWLSDMPEETTVCRCEEVTAGSLRPAISEGHRDVNQVKFLTRCGMGPCQGRQCGQALSHIVARETDSAPDVAGAYRARPPANMLTLGELSQLYPQEVE